MTLRRKLLSTFAGLAAMALLIALVAGWSVAQWARTEGELRSHYERSLLLQRIRAATFRAFKEVPDAVTGDDTDSRQEFDAFLKPARADFAEWSRLAETRAEKAEVARIQAAFEALVVQARRAFTLVEAGRQREAFVLMEGRLEDQNFAGFQKLSEDAVAADRRVRDIINARATQTRDTARLVMLIAALGTVSLGLLLAAYLASDLFAPLHDASDALDDLARGDRERRLPEDRDDELGRLNAAFNAAASSIAQRERTLSAVETADSAEGGEPWRNQPSRLALHAMVSQLQAQVGQAGRATREGNADDEKLDDAEREDTLRQIDDLLRAISRVTDFGFPLDLNRARVDVRALLYEVLVRFHDELARRGVSFDLSVSPEVGEASLDRLKMREALAELIRNGLEALPARGGRIGLRARIEGSTLVLEVADDGGGADGSAIDRALSGRGENGKPAVGLRLTRAIIEQHGGAMDVQSREGEGTYVQISLPIGV